MSKNVSYQNIDDLIKDFAFYTKSSEEKARDFINTWIEYKKEKFNKIDAGEKMVEKPRDCEFIEAIKKTGLTDDTAKDVLTTSLNLEVKLKVGDHWVIVLWEGWNVEEIVRASDLVLEEHIKETRPKVLH